MSTYWLIWGICLAATAGVITRPLRWPEAIWAVAGAVVLVLTGLMTFAAAGAAIAKGLDVYLFLIGMMLLSETARQEGLFDWVAAAAVNHAKGSATRLFALVFAIGTIVTVFLSNDATAVVLTPAVYAAAKKGDAEPLPLLFACAMIANAASFVLPISNPANLVLYGGTMPPLKQWFASFGIASLASIAATYVMLRWAERGRLAGPCARDIPGKPLTANGWTALIGIGGTAVLLLTISALNLPLGLPTCLAGAATTALVCLRAKASPLPILAGVSWTVLPLVAGLFVLVDAIAQTGVISELASYISSGAAQPHATAVAAGSAIAFVSNFMNNLPAGLIASTTIQQGNVPQLTTDALLIGVDLGPNLSITGSLATILWLAAIRREGADVSFWQFLKVGALTMPPALALALGARMLS